MCVANVTKVLAAAVETYSLLLSSGLILVLNKCNFVLSMSKKNISIHELDKEEYSFTIKNCYFSIYLNDMFFASTNSSNGWCLLNKENNVLNIESKKSQINDNSQTYSWHCHLGHINLNRIQKLHRDGLRQSFVYELFDVCEYFFIGKMTRSPFTRKGERANELLSLIHTDVYGPMSTKARGVTITS